MKSLVFVLLVAFFAYSSYERELTISGFNIQVFGQSKISEQEVVDKLLLILERYDLTLVQEIRDASEEAIYVLLNQLNEHVNCATNSEHCYEMVISEREGRTNSKEQYAYIYKKELFQVLNDKSDPDESDKFERPPYMVKWNVKNTDFNFITIGLHAKPDDVFNELEALVVVEQSISEEFNEEKVILLGDFNADGSYLSRTERESLELFTSEEYHNLIEEGVDTTVSGGGSDQTTYDRIIVTDEMFNYIVDGKSGVFNFQEAFDLTLDEAKDISDHYPVHTSIDVEVDDWTVFYQNDFSDGEYGYFNFLKSQTRIEPLPNDPTNNVLGQFGGIEKIYLNIPDSLLPEDRNTKEYVYSVSFDLHVIGSWNGGKNSDTFKILKNSYTKVVEYSFCNSSPNSNERQSYPDQKHKISNGKYICKQDSINQNDLGFDNSATYKIRETFYHTSSDFELRFSGYLKNSKSKIESITEESWSIDNIVLSYKSLDQPMKVASKDTTNVDLVFNLDSNLIESIQQQLLEEQQDLDNNSMDTLKETLLVQLYAVVGDENIKIINEDRLDNYDDNLLVSFTVALNSFDASYLDDLIYSDDPIIQNTLLEHIVQFNYLNEGSLSSLSSSSSSTNNVHIYSFIFSFLFTLLFFSF